MGRNIELKARLADLASARRIAASLAPLDSIQQQTDTYFRASHGRLKLREIEGAEAQLVWYDCADEAGARASDYSVVPVVEPASLKAALAAACGVRCVVTKRREIYLWQNVRIHLDQVSRLGTFVEFEAVISADVSDEQGREQLRLLSERFSLSPADSLDRSYSDMLMRG